ncbi:Uncharacterised protein [Neisseria meningitidis]|nr:Uncharacterised protein [Neisseria meningitidis]CWO76498.1 Uncharacterised protein [Neisseria meningitidis]CWQ03322.1 Uncharacterised protein [Neisseria meningitidis]
MCLCRLRSLARPTVRYRLIQHAVLRHQFRTRIFFLIQINKAAARLPVQHFQQTARQMAEQQIVRRIRNRLMEADIGFALMFQIAAFARLLKLFKPKPNPLQIGIRPAFCRQCRHTALDVAAEIKNILFPIGMLAQKLLPTLQKILLRLDRNIITVSLPRFQNLTGNQNIQCRPDRRARNAELFRQNAFGRNLAPFRVNPFRNALLQYRQYLIADFLRPYQFHHSSFIKIPCRTLPKYSGLTKIRTR